MDGIEPGKNDFTDWGPNYSRNKINISKTINNDSASKASHEYKKNLI